MPLPAIIATRISEHKALREVSRRQGVFQLALGGYVGYKGVTNGLRRALGIRIEEHTTNRKNAKNIIKNGCVLDPKYGGSACSSNNCDIHMQNSKNFVHITGVNDRTIDDFVKEISNRAPKKPETKRFSNPAKSLFKNAYGNIYRKVQKYIYRFYSQPKASEIIKKLCKTESTATKTDVISGFLNLATGYKSKTFYIPGNEEFFNKNFIADADDFALKTNKPLKVCRTKLGAMFRGIKEFGLSGIAQNKTRAITGIAISAALFGASSKLIKSGLYNLKKSKDNGTISLKNAAGNEAGLNNISSNVLSSGKGALEEFQTIEFNRDLINLDDYLYRPEDVNSLSLKALGAKKGTKDGKIGHTKQQSTANCWLLASVNSLNTTKKGRKIIKNAIKWKPDSNNAVSVKLKGLRKTVSITNETWKWAKDAQKKDFFSKGDDDMLAIELAFIAVQKNIDSGKIKISDSIAHYKNEKETNKLNKLFQNGNYPSLALYMLTGREPDITEYDKGELNNALKKYSKNGGKYALTATINGKSAIKGDDIEYKTITSKGKEISLPAGHTYTITKIDEENHTVTIVNPWNSGKKITLDKYSFLRTFDSITSVDLAGKKKKLAEYLD